MSAERIGNRITDTRSIEFLLAESESMLLVAVPNIVWPAAVTLGLSCIMILAISLRALQVIVAKFAAPHTAHEPRAQQRDV